MMNIVICDDEIKICKDIAETLIEHYGTKVEVSCFDNSVATYEYIDNERRGKVDIVILDIRLKHEHGVDVANYLGKKYSHICFIFMSGYADGYKRIFEVEPVYYLEKPINKSQLIEAVDRAIAKCANERELSVTFKRKGEMINIMTSDIDYIESRGRIIYIHTNNDIINVYMKLAEVLKVLPDNFIICHKSFCVNMDKIIRLARQEIELYNGIIIPVSRLSYMKVRELYMDYVMK